MRFFKSCGHIFISIALLCVVYCIVYKDDQRSIYLTYSNNKLANGADTTSEINGRKEYTFEWENYKRYFIISTNKSSIESINIPYENILNNKVEINNLSLSVGSMIFNDHGNEYTVIDKDNNIYTLDRNINEQDYLSGQMTCKVITDKVIFYNSKLLK